MNESLGETIKRKRESLGWSQTDLARAVGYASNVSIANIEGARKPEGRRRTQIPVRLPQIVEVLGISHSELPPDVVEFLTVPCA
jgi:transcriptional regulator with XRE-family HTH domain